MSHSALKTNAKIQYLVNGTCVDKGNHINTTKKLIASISMSISKYCQNGT